MTPIKQQLIVLFLFLISLPNLIGQDLSIVGGIGLSNQDRRSFSRSGTLTTYGENNTSDYETSLYLEKTFFKYRFLQVDGGLGYAEINTSLHREFDQAQFGVFTDDLSYIRKYTINKLILPLSSKFFIKNTRFYLQINAVPGFAFRKSVIKNHKGGRVLTKWQFDWHSIEINPGIGINLTSRLHVFLQYRCLYFHEIDEVLFVSGRDVTFPLGKTDKYNPFKMGLMVGYKIEE